MKDVAAILLAAGQSRRMGAFKPLLPFGKQTVIESCLNYLIAGGVETVVVVLGHRAAEIQSRLDHPSIRFAFNPDPTSEMGDSIAIGAEQLPETAKATFIALVDYPAVPAAVVTELIMEWSKGATVVKPLWQGQGGHPVIIDLKLRDELTDLAPETGLKGVFNRHKNDVKRVEVNSPYVAWDIDTWDDYVTLYEEIFGRIPPEPETL